MDSLSSANHFDNLFKKWAVEKLGSGVQIPETEFKCFVYQPETNSEQEKWNTNFSKKIERESNDIKPHPAYVWTMANRPHTGITLFSKHPNKDYMGSILSCFIAPPKQGFRLENMAKTEVTFSDFPNILIITCTRTLKEYDDLELTKHMLQYVIEHILVHSSELSVGWILFSNPGTNHRDPKCTLESFTVESLSKAYNFLKLTYKENTSHRKNDYLVGDTPNPGFPLYAYSYFTNDDKTKRELIANENNIYGVHIKTLDRKFIRRFTYPNTDDIYFSDHTQLDFFGDHVLVNEKGNRGLPYQLPHQQWVGEEGSRSFFWFRFFSLTFISEEGF